MILSDFQQDECDFTCHYEPDSIAAPHTQTTSSQHEKHGSQTHPQSTCRSSHTQPAVGMSGDSYPPPPPLPPHERDAGGEEGKEKKRREMTSEQRKGRKEVTEIIIIIGFMYSAENGKCNCRGARKGDPREVEG